MEQQKIIEELAEIQKKITGYLEILGSDKVLRKVIVTELREIKKKFADERRTEIGPPVSQMSMEDLIADEDVVITVTHNSYLKRTPVTTYRQQVRGGRGRIGMGKRTDDFVEHLIIGSTHSYFLVFTNLGRVYWLRIYDIPDVGITGRGKNIVNLLNFQPNETVQAFLPVKEFAEGRYIVMATRNGVIKKCDLSVFKRPLSRGIIALALDEGDELISARLTDPGREIFVATSHGKAIRFHEDAVRAMGRPARGVRAIRIDPDDRVIGMIAVPEDVLVLSITENGFGKRTKIDQYRLTQRGGKGVINIKTTKRNGNVVAIMTVAKDIDLMLITRGGKIIRIESDKIRATGRSAQGVTLVNVEDGDQIAAACVVPHSQNDDDGTNGAPSKERCSSLGCRGPAALAATGARVGPSRAEKGRPGEKGGLPSDFRVRLISEVKKFDERKSVAVPFFRVVGLGSPVAAGTGPRPTERFHETPCHDTHSHRLSRREFFRGQTSYARRLPRRSRMLVGNHRARRPSRRRARPLLCPDGNMQAKRFRDSNRGRGLRHLRRRRQREGRRGARIGEQGQGLQDPRQRPSPRRRNPSRVANDRVESETRFGTARLTRGR